MYITYDNIVDYCSAILKRSPEVGMLSGVMGNVEWGCLRTTETVPGYNIRLDSHTVQYRDNPQTNPNLRQAQRAVNVTPG